MKNLRYYFVLLIMVHNGKVEGPFIKKLLEL